MPGQNESPNPDDHLDPQPADDPNASEASTERPDPNPSDSAADRQDPAPAETDKPHADTAARADPSATEADDQAAESPDTTASQTDADPRPWPDGDPLFVVAVGASAGGLEAYSTVLKNLPPDTGMTFLFVQHLDPSHKSKLVPILARDTDMPVFEAEDGVRMEANHVYVMPAHMDLRIEDGLITLVPRPERSEPHMPINQCFRTLAEAQGQFAVGVVLSGTGSDGTTGLGEIKAAGGFCIVQDPATAKYEGMPAHAIDAGFADLVLSPEDIAEELIRLDDEIATRLPPKPPGETLGFDDKPLQRIFHALRRSTAVDFSQYKISTLERRIARRMVVHQIDDIDRYVDYLNQNEEETQALFADMLIGVTGFFREPQSFEALKRTAFDEITAEKDDDTPIRIWVPGCATGEEAYSIVICLLEYLEAHDLQTPIQVFATDVNEPALGKARAGVYPPNIVEDVSSQRLRRRFHKVDAGYQIHKTIRDLCVFAKQDITRDPPFSRVDLISCRNVLIYLKPESQRRVIPIFHYALQPHGFLQLGGSESVGGFAGAFQAVDVKHKLYRKKPGATRPPVDFGTHPPSLRFRRDDEKAEDKLPAKAFDLQREADRTVLNRYAPPGVVVDEDMQILQFRGRTSRYLEHAPGTPSLHLFDLCRPGLLARLRKALSEAKGQKGPLRQENLRVDHNGETLDVTVVVHPMKAPETDKGYFMILFEEQPLPVVADGADNGASAAGDAQSIQDLRHELDEVSQTLQQTLEEHHTVTEELRAANEEIQSSNEELQTTNEELETAKEELQSSNEELTTLNEELESRNADLSRMTDDQRNLIDSVNIPVLTVGPDLRIRTFTASAEETLGLRMGDIGRPIRELKLGLALDGLEDRIRDVVEQLDTVEEDIRSSDGSAVYSLRIRPYVTVNNKIDGATLVLVDITDRTQAREQAETARKLLTNVLDTIQEPLVVLDGDLNVVFAGRGFYETFDVAPDQTEDKRLYDLGNGQWDIPALRELLEKILPERSTIEDFSVEHDFPSIGRRTMLLSARQVRTDNGERRYILLTLRDDTGESEDG